MSARLLALVGIMSLSILLCGEREASAQDVTGKVYDDAKSVLEDLIRKEAATGVVRYMLHVDQPTATQVSTLGRDPAKCQALAEKAFPSTAAQDFVAFYFHDALERLYEGQLGSVGRELRTGLLDLLTDVVFEIVAERAYQIDSFAKLKQRSSTTVPPPPSPFRLGDALFKIRADLGDDTNNFAWKLYLHLECGLELPPSTTAVEAQCHAMGSGDLTITRAACNIAHAVRAELSNAPTEMEFYLQELVATLFTSVTVNVAPSRTEALFRHWLAEPQLFKDEVRRLASERVPSDLASVTGSCPSDLSTLSLSQTWTAGQETCWSWKLADRAQNDPSIALSECPNKPSLSNFIDAYRQSAAGAGVERIRDALAKTLPGTACAATTDADFVVAAQHFPLIKSGALDRREVDVLQRLESYLDEGDKLRQAAIALGFTKENLSSADALQVAFLLRAQAMIEFVDRARDYVVNTGGSAKATAEPLSELAFQAFDSACGADRSYLCSVTDVLKTTFSDPAFRDLVRQGVRADYRALAARVLDQLLPSDADWPEGGICANGLNCRRFIIAFAGYALDMATEGGNDSAARAAFESAAEDVLVETPDERRLFPPRGKASLWWQTFLVPSASLRLSWSPDYYNGVGSDQFRYVVSLDELTAVRWAPFRNFGLQASFVDLAAPFAELAFRPRAHVQNGEAVVFDLVRPRLDALFAVPEFSRRLVLSAGVAMRTYSVDYTPSPAANQLPTLTYHAITSCIGGDASCIGYRASGEFNMGVKYLF